MKTEQNTTIPLYEFEPCVDYHVLIKTVEEKFNIDTRDFAGSYSEEAKQERKDAQIAWMDANGYEGKAYVLDVPDSASPREDWPKDSPEMALRIEINTALRPLVNEHKRPYQDFWHQHCDEIRRGGINTLWLHNDGDTPEWVGKINNMIKSVLVGNAAYDAEEECVSFYVDW